jgi:hypothetical protein
VSATASTAWSVAWVTLSAHPEGEVNKLGAEWKEATPVEATGIANGNGRGSESEGESAIEKAGSQRQKIDLAESVTERGSRCAENSTTS